jgi:hypothetical protein
MILGVQPIADYSSRGNHTMLEFSHIPRTDATTVVKCPGCKLWVVDDRVAIQAHNERIHGRRR